MTILNTRLGWVVSRQTSDLLRLWCPRFWSGAMVVAGSALGRSWTPCWQGEQQPLQPLHRQGTGFPSCCTQSSNSLKPTIWRRQVTRSPIHIRNSLSNVQIVQCMGNLMESHEFLMTSLLILLFVYVSMIFYGNGMKSGNRSVDVGHGRQGRSFKMFLTPGLRHAGKYWKILQDGAHGAPAKLVYKKLCHNHSVWCANR